MKRILPFVFIMVCGTGIFAQCNDLFFSEYVEGSGNNRALEIYNPTSAAIDLSGYQLVRYSNGETTPNIVGISGIVASNDVYVTVSDKRDPNGTGYEEPVDSALMEKADTFLCPVYSVNKMHYFNGNDAVTLEKTNGVYVDIIGVIGEDPGDGWTSDTSAGFTSANGYWLAWTSEHTMIRKGSVLSGIIANPSFFNPAVEWDTLAQNAFDSLQFHNCDCHPSIGINTVEKPNDFFVYPNPVVGEDFLIKASEIIADVYIYDMTGKILFYHENPVQRGDMLINTNAFNSAMYVVRVKFIDGTERVRKIMLK